MKVQDSSMSMNKMSFCTQERHSPFHTQEAENQVYILQTGLVLVLTLNQGIDKDSSKQNTVVMFSLKKRNIHIQKLG